MDEHSKWAPQAVDYPAAEAVMPGEEEATARFRDEDFANQPAANAAKTNTAQAIPTGVEPRYVPSGPLVAEMPTSTEAKADADRGSKPSDEEEKIGRFKPLSDSYKIGILGGTNVGKTYLFQAMAYRLQAGATAGALAYYRPSCELWEFPFSENGQRGLGKVVALQKFLNSYRTWIPLKTTERATQKWYCLRTRFRSGWLGRSFSTMDIEFLDGAGEGLANDLGSFLPTWKVAFSDAKFMIFCLPIWALFPADYLSADNKERRESLLQEFDNVVTNYKRVRAPHLKVRTVLALTMADDTRCSLHTIRQRWIEPLMERTRTNDYLRQMRSTIGPSRYLASARKVSKYLYRCLEETSQSEPFLPRIPEQLDFGFGLPTMIPVTALEGSILSPRIEASFRGETLPTLDQPPVPAHVELPLLAALCAKYNILM